MYNQGDLFIKWRTYLISSFTNPSRLSSFLFGQIAFSKFWAKIPRVDKRLCAKAWNIYVKRPELSFREDNIKGSDGNESYFADWMLNINEELILNDIS